MSSSDTSAGSNTGGVPQNDPGQMAGVMGGGGSTATVDPDMQAMSNQNAQAAGNGSGMTDKQRQMLSKMLAQIGTSSAARGGTAQPGLQQTAARPMYSAGGGTISTGGQ